MPSMSVQACKPIWICAGPGSAFPSCSRPDRAGSCGRRGIVEDPTEFILQHDIQLPQSGPMAEVVETGHTITRVRNSARNDAGIVGEIAADIDRDAMKRDPVFDSHPDGGDLVLAARPFFRPANPNPDAARAPLPGDPELGKREDDPFFEASDEPAHVRASAPEIEHNIS